MSPVSIKLLHMRAPFKRRGRREWGGEQRTGDGGEWDHLWMLRRMLGQPILCPDNYQVPAELVGCWNLKKKKNERNEKKNYALLNVASRPSCVSALVREKTNVQYDWSAARNEQLLEIMRNKWSGLCHWHTFTHTHTDTWQHTGPPRFN